MCLLFLLVKLNEIILGSYGWDVFLSNVRERVEGFKISNGFFYFYEKWIYLFLHNNNDVI